MTQRRWRPWSRYQELLDRLGDLGYRLREFTFGASAFGVPQKRQRLFVVCDRETEPAEVSPPGIGKKAPTAKGNILKPDSPSDWRETGTQVTDDTAMPWVVDPFV